MIDLLDISDYVQMIAEAITSAFDVNITITNNNLIRVAGTGYFRESIGLKIPHGCISQKAILEGNKFLIDNPRVSPECKECKKTDCKDEICFCSPIIREGKVIGVINLTSTSKEQKYELLSKKNNIMKFTEQMGDLIITKINERIKHYDTILLNNQLDAIIEVFDEGIIVVNSECIIQKVNKYAERLLSTKKSSLIGQSLKELIPELSLKNKSYKNIEVKLVFKNKKIQVMCSSQKLFSQPLGYCGQVFFIKDISDVRRFVYNMTGKNLELTFKHIIGNSSQITKVKNFANQISKSSSTVLIRGETGTGKELFARAIHNSSLRKNGPFIAINCSAIPENLLESELFGYNEGAFTGAMKGGKPGKLELADRGTLFLDEIGDMPLHLQAKLLRVIGEKEFTRLGSINTTKVDIRIIAATNAKLEELIKEKRFREDLYYRLNVLPIYIPPLRERKEDIVQLIDNFLLKYCTMLNKNILGFSNEALACLINYSWPGNVRELQNIVELLVNLETSEYISVHNIPYFIKSNNVDTQLDVKLTKIHQIEKSLLEKAYNRYGSSKNSIAKISEEIGISKSSVYRKLKEYGIKGMS